MPLYAKTKLAGLQDACIVCASSQAPNQPLAAKMLHKPFALCYLQCLENLFSLWMWGLRNAQGGDLRKHVSASAGFSHPMHHASTNHTPALLTSQVIVIANGAEAYAKCTALKEQHPHQCMLDAFCQPEQGLSSSTYRNIKDRRSTAAKTGHAGSGSVFKGSGASSTSGFEFRSQVTG